MAIIGSGEYTYQVSGEDWGTLPDGWTYKEATAVAVDARDNVYVFNRGNHPVIVFDRDGKFLRSWGEGIFTNPHGVAVGPDDTVFCVDASDHTVRKYTTEGKLLMTIGTEGKGAPPMSGDPFSLPTHVAVDPRNGDLYVADGYSNARVHKYTPDGRLLFSWGESGTNPGQFNVVHNIATDLDGWLYVADRENRRIQVFDPNGKYETQWGTCPGPPACAPTIGASNWSMWESTLPVRPSTPPAPDSVPGCPYSTRLATCSPGWAMGRREKSPAGSTHPMGSRWTPGATSTWQKSRGRSTERTWSRPESSARCRSWSGWTAPGAKNRGCAEVRSLRRLSCFGTEYLDTEYSIPKYSAPR